MKNFKKILPLALLALLVVTGCNREVGSKVPTSVTVQDGIVQGQSAAVNNEAGAEVLVSRYGTKMDCSQLKSAERRQECEMQLNDTIGGMLEAEITSSYDIERCKELPSDIGTRCQEKLTEAGVKGPVSVEEMTLFNEILRGKPSDNSENPATVYDSTRCTELTTAGYKEYCEKRLKARADQEKVMEIMQSKDKTRCNELTTESIKNECKRFFGEEVVEPVAEAPVAETPAEGVATTPEETPIQ